MQPIPIEISARHVHLSQADWDVLFPESTIEIDRAISQPHQFVAKQRFSIRGPKHSYDLVAIIGPFRPQSQCELSVTDARFLGITPPLTESGNLEGATPITLVGPGGTIERPIAIVSKRHVHMDPATAIELNLRDRQTVTVHIPGPRAVFFERVAVRIHKEFTLSLHLDTDEGNTCGWHTGMTAEIVR